MQYFKYLLFIFILIGTSNLQALEDLPWLDSEEQKNKLRISIEQDRKEYMRLIRSQTSSVEEKETAHFYLGVLNMIKRNSRSVYHFMKSEQSSDVLISSPSRVNLGMIYLHGKGVDKDIEQSFNWFSKAAKQGNAVAIEEILVMCTNQEISQAKLLELSQWSIDQYKKPLETSDYLIAERILSVMLSCPATNEFIRSALRDDQGVHSGEDTSIASWAIRNPYT